MNKTTVTAFRQTMTQQIYEGKNLREEIKNRKESTCVCVCGGVYIIGET